MVKKFDVITKLYEEATQEVTESPEKWIAFLRSASKITACRLMNSF